MDFTRGDYKQILSKFHRITTKEEFLRAVFIELTRNEKSPFDILSAEFGEVEEGEVQGFAVYGVANGFYSATIGIDRKEEYIVQEYGFVGSNVPYTLNGHPKVGTGTSVLKDVKKTRIVTDWMPHNGEVVNYSTSDIVLEEEYNYLYKNFRNLLKRNDLNSIHEEFEDFQSLPSNILSEGINQLELNTSLGISVCLPGDRHKDFTCSTCISDYKIYRCIVPTYKLKYIYKGKEYVVEGFAIKDERPFVESPYLSDESISEEKLNDNKKEEVLVAEKPYVLAKILAIVSILFFIIGASGVGIYEPEGLNIILMSLGFGICGALLLSAGIISIIVSIKVKKINKKYEESVKVLQKIKLIYLYKKLKRYGYKKLSKIEETLHNCELSKLTMSDLNMDLNQAVICLKELNSKEIVSNLTKKTKIVILTVTALLVCLSVTIPLIVSVREKQKQDEINEAFRIENNILVDYDHEVATKYNIKSVTIPNGVTIIGGLAFGDCSSLTSITIPSSVTIIGDYAFSGCSSLTSIEIPNTVTSIGEGAFFGCSSLTSIKIPNTVTSIGDEAFSRCSSLTSIVIPEGVISIGDYAFYYCSSLTSITIPSSVTSIGGNAFFCCSSLTSIEILEGVTSIRNNAFYHCSSLTSIEIPNTVTSIGHGAFSGCSSLTSITIPASVTSIEDSAFSECSSLTSIEIPNTVTSIGNYAFAGCSSLTNIVIPEGVTSIGEGAFYYCSSLTSIVIPEGVTSIGNKAFSDCSSLTNIVIPEGVTTIGRYAFYYCSSLTNIVIPEGVITIGSYAFSECSSLTIYCNESKAPSEWDSLWNYSNRPVYWAGQWEYDANGNPVPLS